MSRSRPKCSPAASGARWGDILNSDRVGGGEDRYARVAAPQRFPTGESGWCPPLTLGCQTYDVMIRWVGLGDSPEHESPTEKPRHSPCRGFVLPSSRVDLPQAVWLR